LPTFEPFFNPVVHVAGRKQFLVGDRVRIQNAVLKRWDDKGKIREIRDNGRSYYVDRDIRQGTVLRNNIFLKRCAAPFVHEAAEKNQMSSHPLPVPIAVPAIAVPAARDHPIRVRKHPVCFAP
jgi:hypothetical protein